jgi:hypothetical protein
MSVLGKWLRKDIGIQAVCLAFMFKKLIKENAIISNKTMFLSPGIQGGSWAKQSFSRDNAALGAYAIWPSKDPSFFAINNPINAGLESLRLVIGLDKTGIDLANAFGSIAPMAHLYNTLQQCGLLRGRWYALDKFITAHISPLFKGSLPTTQDQSIRRFFLCVQVLLCGIHEYETLVIPLWDP